MWNPKLPEIGEALTTVLKMFRMLMMPFSEYLEKLPLPSIRRFEKARDRLDPDHLRAHPRAAQRAARIRAICFPCCCWRRTKKADGGGMTDKQVRDEALTLVPRRPRDHGQRADLDLVSAVAESGMRSAAAPGNRFGAGRPRARKWPILPQLRYTEMVFAEAMRLYPPAWAIGRMSQEPFELGGVQIAAKIDLHRQPLRHAARSALVSGSRTFRPRALDSGSARGPPEIFLFSVRRRRAGLHRRTIRVDGRRASTGHAGAEMEVAVGGRSASGDRCR